VIGASPVAAEPSLRANEAAGEAETTKNAKATVTEVLDTGKGSIMNAGETDLCSQSADTIKLN
jgi:hypothetical protein